MATTITVATPATANVPEGPWRTISSTRASSSLTSDTFAIVLFPLFRQQLAQVVDLCRRHWRSRVVPRGADIRDHCRHLVVIQDVRERRHSVRPRILARA